MTNEKLGTPAPVVLAMVLCDAIHQDPATRKCTLLGTFSAINVRKFPATHRQLAVHVALTEGRGKTRIRLRLIHSDNTETEVFSREGTIEFADPRVVAELNFTINNIVFESSGEYRLQVFGNDELLKERRLYVQGPPANPPKA